MDTLPSRRGFLRPFTSTAAAVVAAHGRIDALGGDPGALSAAATGKPAAVGAGERAPRILGLELLSAAPVAEMKEFHGARPRN